MSQLFISYSRVDSTFVERLLKRIQQAFPHLTIWHDQSPHGLIGGDNWWEEILNAIAASDVFIYVLSNESVQSLYCQAEFTEARRLQKRIITIQARDKTTLTDDLDDIQFIDMKDGVDDPDALQRLTASINKQRSLAKKHRPLWKPATPKPRKEAPSTRTADAPTIQTAPLERPNAEVEALRLARSGVRWQIIGIGISLLLGVLALIVPLLLDRNNNASGENPTSVAQVSNTPAPTATNFPSSTPDAAFTSTLSASEELQTAYAEQTAAAETRTAFDLTATIQFVAAGSATAAAQLFDATETAARLTLIALFATATPPPTHTPVPPTATYTPTSPPTFAPGDLNSAWTPRIEMFDGVQMAYVPAGCFMMGSENGGEDEQPVHQVCLEAFWLDVYEVTQADFERLGGVKAAENGFDGERRPIERITWFEARDFCALRGGRLPTEAEWEYAARGPQGYMYPWGDAFVAENAVYFENSNNQTAEVGSRAGGVSWVGAYDLSGNVWEWVNTIYGIDDGDYDFDEEGERRYLYPYTEGDGREQDSEDRTFVRVLRGGSWNYNDYSLRAANRIRFNPAVEYFNNGFRCARSQ